MIDAISLLAMVMESLGYCLIFQMLLRKDRIRFKWLTLVLEFFSLLGCILLIALLFDHFEIYDSFFRLVANVLVFTLILSVFHKDESARKLYVALFSYLLVYIIDYYYVIIYQLAELEISMTLLVVLSKCTLLLAFLSIAVADRKVVRRHLSKPLRYILSIFILCTLFISNLLFSMADHYPKEALVASTLILLLNAALMVIVRYRVRYEQLQIHQHYTDNQIKELKSISLEEYKFLQFHHDIYNHLTCVREFSNQKDYKRMDEYLDSILPQMDHTSWKFQTNSGIVDAILNRKAAIAAQNGIVLVPTINDLSPLNSFIDRDIAAILSNIFDNAIERCCKNEKKKYILFKMISRDAHVVISIQNPIESQEQLTSSVKKWKPDSGLHGVGLSSVRHTLEKLGGEHVIIHEENSYRISMMIPLPV